MSAAATAFVVFVLAVALNGLFAGYETGFISADRLRIRFLAEEEDNARAALLLRHIRRPERLLATVLLGTNLALIMGTMAITEQVKEAWLATLIATPTFLIFAEIVPKSVFRRHPNRLALFFLPIIRAFDLIMTPIVAPTVFCIHVLRRLIGSKDEEVSPVLNTEEDFRHLVDELK